MKKITVKETKSFFISHGWFYVKGLSDRSLAERASLEKEKYERPVLRKKIFTGQGNHKEL